MRTWPTSFDLHAIARSCGVTLVDSAANCSTGRPAEHCSCKPTVPAIAAAHGAAHLPLCFRLCTETGNGRELHAAKLTTLAETRGNAGLIDETSVWTVSDRVLACPEWVEERTSD